MLSSLVKASLLLIVLGLFVKGSSFKWDLMGKPEAREVLTSLLHWWEGTKWLAIPIIVGVGLSTLTWQTVCLDSDVPGIDPPQPFSSQPGPKFHLGYLFALTIGPIVTAMLLFLEYG